MPHNERTLLRKPITFVNSAKEQRTLGMTNPELRTGLQGYQSLALASDTSSRNVAGQWDCMPYRQYTCPSSSLLKERSTIAEA